MLKRARLTKWEISNRSHETVVADCAQLTYIRENHLLSPTFVVKSRIKYEIYLVLCQGRVSRSPRSLAVTQYPTAQRESAASLHSEGRGVSRPRRAGSVSPSPRKEDVSVIYLHLSDF